KALREYLERNQGLGKKTTNFIFGANRPPEHTLEEYLAEIATYQGYSPKYEEYVQKTGQLIDEVEKVRAEAISRFEGQEAERKQASIKEALEELLEDDEIKEVRLEKLIAEEYLNRNLYEEKRANIETYVDNALAYYQTYILTGRIRIAREKSEPRKIFRRKEQTLTPPQYVLNEYLHEVKSKQGYSEKYVEYLKATGEKIAEVEAAIVEEIKRAEVAEIKRQQKYIEQSAAVLKEFSEQDLEKNIDLMGSLAAECRSRNRYLEQLAQSENYVQKALEAYEADEFKERTLAENEHVLRYTLQEYAEEIVTNQGYSAKYAEYMRVTGQRNLEIEKTIDEAREKLKEQEMERRNKVLTELLAEIGQEDPGKAVVLNNLLEKERLARNNYEIERRKLATYLNDIENVTTRRKSYVPQYTRNEYLAEIQAHHGYSPKYLEDLRRIGNEQRDRDLEAAIEEAIKKHEVQEGYRRERFIHTLAAEVEKLDPYVVQLEEIISTEYPWRRAYETHIVKTRNYTDKALRDYHERNQGLGMKTTNFILGANRAPQYTLEEYLTEIETNQGYSAKYEEYVQKTGQLINEVEKVRAEATSRF
ncbi:MAG TPA: hypothetical protein GX532_08065, partial [Clostridia bacterium]|nr:hypothetical protein [Clostridia bacterium]